MIRVIAVFLRKTGDSMFVGCVYLLNYAFESSVHPSIIDAPKGMATGFPVFFLEKLNEESLFLA